MARKKHHESHENHERWLLTYADLITLLLAFFIILFALSDVNKEKYNSFAHSLKFAFSNSQMNDPINFDLNMQNLQKERVKQTEKDLKTMEAVKENNELAEIKKKIDQTVKDNGMESKIQTGLSVEGLKIVLSDEILFDSGKAALKPAAFPVINEVANLLLAVNNPVKVSGHTDSDRISTREFPSNWELSTARATSVLRQILNAQANLEPLRFSAAGFGEYQPISSNATEDGKRKNRRVEILIERKHAVGLLKTNDSNDKGGV